MSMTDRTKKFIFAVFFITFSIGVGYLLFTLFFQAQTPSAIPAPAPNSSSGQLPSAGAGSGAKITTTPTVPGIPGAGTIPGTAPTGLPQAAARVHLLHDGLTQDLSPSPNGNGQRFYNPDDGRFYKVNNNGAVTLMSDKQFYNVSNVDWGNKTDQAIMRFPDGSKIYYNFTSQRQVRLPSHWSGFDFASNDAVVAAKSIGLDPDNRFLFISKPDGTEAKAIEPLGDNADLMTVDWNPSSQIVGYSFTGSPQGGTLQQEVLFIGQNHENFKSIIAPGAGFLPNWSPSGKHILYSVWGPFSNGRPDLWVSESDPAHMGANRRNLQVKTWADKCVWANETELYCGVPQGLPANAGLERSDFTTLPDDVYKIDLQSGISTKISTPDQTHPIQNPVLSNDKTKLIFTDAQSGKLYSYDL